MISGEKQTRHLIAGAVSGAVATGVTAPMELVKTVLQSGAVNSKNVTSTRVSTLGILQEQVKFGGVKACFRGLSPSLAGIVPHSGFYFALYAPMKKSFFEKPSF